MSRMGRAVAMIVALCSITGCESPTVPDRGEVYPFHLETSPPLVFHWPLGSTIRVHVAEGANPSRARLRDATEIGARAWNDAVLYGEYRLDLGAPASAADVVLRWSDVPLPVGLPSNPPPGCRFEVGRAVTTFCFDADRRLLVFPQTEGAAGRVRMVVTISSTEGADLARLTALVTHELGHVLGLWQHPDPIRYPASVMLSNPGSMLPARVDRAAVQVLYQTRADIGT